MRWPFPLSVHFFYAISDTLMSGQQIEQEQQGSLKAKILLNFHFISCFLGAYNGMLWYNRPKAIYTGGNYYG